MSAGVTVIKIGGSVLAGPHAYRRAAADIGDRLCRSPGVRIVAVVSAALGVTDSLLATARAIAEAPDPSTVDLLWSTGEVRSAALLALSLQALGVRVVAANVHQAGLVCADDGRAREGTAQVSPLRLRALMAGCDVVVVPGFFARGAGDALVSLGRGGSDLTAVLLAAGLGAATCELLKDVPGVFTADPKRDPGARLLASLTFARALAMADAGSALVQRQALEAARASRVPLVVRGVGRPAGTVIDETETAI